MEYESDLTGLGRFIREQRKRLNLTQEMLGSRLGWAQERISTLENGKIALPTLPQFWRLGNALDVPLQELLRHAVPGPYHTASTPAGDAVAAGHAGGLSKQMVAVIDHLHQVEGHLQQAERELTRANELRASVRARREQMAALLAASREA